MRAVVKRFADAVFAAVPPRGPVYEFGSMEVNDPANPEVGNFRGIVERLGLAYVGCDMRAGPGVDCIQDLHALDLPDASVGTAILADTIEHVEYPRRAIDGLQRVLRSDGMLLVTTVMNFPIHAYPEDYWRFTPKGLQSVLKPFAGVFVSCCGNPLLPRTVVGVAFNSPPPAAQRLERQIARWQQQENRRAERIAQRTQDGA